MDHVFCIRNTRLFLKIDEYSQILIGECPEDEVQYISRLPSQCANMKFSDQISYNKMFQQVHKGWES